jgi:hypothetical protein
LLSVVFALPIWLIMRLPSTTAFLLKARDRTYNRCLRARATLHRQGSETTKPSAIKSLQILSMIAFVLGTGVIATYDTLHPSFNFLAVGFHYHPIASLLGALLPSIMLAPLVYLSVGRNLRRRYYRQVIEYDSAGATPIHSAQEKTVMTIAPNSPTSGDQTIRLNPLKWKPEHRAGLAMACAAGTVIGIVTGYATSHLPHLTFAMWLTRFSDDAVAYSIMGALVAGAAVYCHRMFSK